MAKLKLRGKDLIRLGFAQSPAVGLAIDLMHRHYKHESKASALDILKQVLQAPEDFAADPQLGKLAQMLVAQHAPPDPMRTLKETGEGFAVFGKDQIEASALEQMALAMRLPVSRAGALMPDAHHGYGLPIGGVLAVENAVIPYGVGMDIGCRMCLSIFAIPAERLDDPAPFRDLLLEHSRFGLDVFDKPMEDAVLERPEFREIPTVKALRQKARSQIGTSGSGNHFVEFGAVRIDEERLGLPAGYYLGLLTHSGSRGFGANVAAYYTKMAREQCRLPRQAQHLSWLDLDHELGIEYWKAMNLAGDYASACHHHIHHHIRTALGESPLAMVENHHNFAWEETLPDGATCIVHRKGATPAGKGVLGIIPGSMTAQAFIVAGKGVAGALSSASHGAGRKMSRRMATQSFTRKQLKEHLRRQGVTLLGGGLDEAPFAYKDIDAVMAAQKDLVEVLGTFQPRIVRMDEGGKGEG